MMLDLAAIVRMDTSGGIAADMDGVLAPYVMERFFKHLVIGRWRVHSFVPNAIRRGSRMRRPDGPTIRRTCLGTWLAAGALATGYGCLVSGCSPMTPVVEPIAPAATIDGLESAEQAWRAERTAEHDRIWERGEWSRRRSVLGWPGRIPSGVCNPRSGVVERASDAFDKRSKAIPILRSPAVAGFRPRADGP